MDLTNLRNHQDELINHMKASGYSMSCIYMYKRQIREILELDMDSWASYKDIYQYFESVSANKKDLNWRRSVIGGIEHFDLEHLFPDRRRTCSFIEPKGAYYSLKPEFQKLIDHYISYAEKIGKAKESTIDNESHGGATFFYHLQNRGCSTLASASENDVLSYFVDENGNLIHSAGCCKNVKAVLKAGVEIDKAACEKALLFLPRLTEHRKNIQVLTDEELENIKQLLNAGILSLRDNAILHLLLYTGLRGIDIVQLKLQSIDWSRDCMKLVQSKTKTELELPLSPVVGNALYDYIITERPHCKYNTLFISEVVPYEPLKVQTIRWIVRKSFKLANIRTNAGDRIGTHLFRHNITTKLLEHNTALPIISNILGHSSPRSVEPYLHADFLHLKECALSIEKYPVRQEVFNID